MDTRKRMSAPKVRTGCITCKARRVKCDERKPTCLRCEGAARHCQGYRRTKTTQTLDRTLVPIVPKPGYHGQSYTPSVHFHWQLSPSRAIPSVSFAPENVAYFELFRNKIVFQLGARRARIVMRESMRDECVRQAAVAIGALAYAMFIHFQPKYPSDLIHPVNPFAQGEITLHHRAAIRAYLSAMSQCSERLSQREYERSPRSFIIITLLLLAFQFLEGNVAAADGLMKAGISLLKPFIAFFPLSKQAVQEEDMSELAHILPCLAISSGLTQLFSSHHHLLESMQVTCDSSFPRSGQETLPTVLGFWRDFYLRNWIFVMKTLRNNCRGLKQDQKKAEALKTTFLSHLYRWRAILHGLLAGRADPAARNALQFAQTHLILAIIFTQCCLDPTELAFDEFEPQFRSILKRFAILHSGQAVDPSFPFTYGGHIAPPLCLAASKCRSWELRMRLIQVVRELRFREGPWDPKTQAVGLTGLARLEHPAGSEDLFVPSTSRWCWTGASWNNDRSQLLAEYTRLAPCAEGAAVVTHIVLDMEKAHAPWS